MKQRNTNFCDPQDRQVQQLAMELRIGRENDDVAFAIAAFNFVRDEIKYTVLHDWSVPVSYTLTTKSGNCGTKACLLVALLRAGGLKAEFSVERIDTAKSFFFVPKFVTGSCNNKKSLHFSVVVYLEGRGLRVDPSVDWDLACGISGVIGDYFQVVFDGKSHAVPGGKSGEYMQLPDLEYYMEKKSKVSRTIRNCFNLSIEFCRAKGRQFKTQASLLEQVEAFMRNHHPETVRTVLSELRHKSPVPLGPRSSGQYANPIATSFNACTTLAFSRPST